MKSIISFLAIMILRILYIISHDDDDDDDDDDARTVRAT